MNANGRARHSVRATLEKHRARFVPVRRARSDAPCLPKRRAEFIGLMPLLFEAWILLASAPAFYWLFYVNAYVLGESLRLCVSALIPTCPRLKFQRFFPKFAALYEPLSSPCYSIAGVGVCADHLAVVR